MGDLPIIFPYGFVYLYGRGDVNGQVGVVGGTTSILFATIYGVGVGMDSGIVGNSILFKDEDSVCTLLYDNQPYTVLPEVKIIGTENFL